MTQIPLYQTQRIPNGPVPGSTAFPLEVSCPGSDKSEKFQGHERDQYNICQVVLMLYMADRCNFCLYLKMKKIMNFYPYHIFNTQT